MGSGQAKSIKQQVKMPPEPGIPPQAVHPIRPKVISLKLERVYIDRRLKAVARQLAKELALPEELLNPKARLASDSFGSVETSGSPKNVASLRANDSHLSANKTSSCRTLNSKGNSTKEQAAKYSQALLKYPKCEFVKKYGESCFGEVICIRNSETYEELTIYV